MARLRIFLLIALLVTPSAAYSFVSGSYLVHDVLDGDTVVLENGVIVRYVGVDTPEVNEPFWLEAKVRNMSLVTGRRVRVSVCGPESRDRYGRVLAWVYSDDTRASISEILIREGLGRALSIPPCGTVTAERFEKAEAEAKAGKLGVWGHAAELMAPEIGPGAAWMHIGRQVRVKGVVRDVWQSGWSWVLDFGPPEGFRAIVLPRAFPEFQRKGIDLHALRGKEVVITGVVIENRGRPEILIDSPSRLE